MARQTTVTDLFRARAQEHGDSVAYICRSPDGSSSRCELTWSRLYRLAGHYAVELNAMGLGKGDLVVNTLVNSPERAVCEAAIWLSGAASVHGQCLEDDGSDLMHTLRASRAAAVLVDPDVSNSPWPVLVTQIYLGEGDPNTVPDNIRDLKVLFVRRIEGGGTEDFLTHLDAQTESYHAEDIGDEDTLVVLPTSGTSGLSKQVVYTNSDALRCYADTNEQFLQTVSKKGGKLRPGSRRILKTAPLGFLDGCLVGSIITGDTVVGCDVRAGGLPEDVPGFICRAIKEERCDGALIADTYLPAVAQRMKTLREGKADPGEEEEHTEKKELQFVSLSGGPVSRAMVEAALSFAEVAVISYGGTDFQAVSMHAVTDGQTYVDFDTGPPLRGVSVKIVSQDDEETELPVDQRGHILVKGTRKPPSYLSADPKHEGDEADSDLREDGYFRTGDIGRLDERGHLIVHGKSDDAIMRGVYVYFPVWMESCIRACPGVSDVLVTGIPDPLLNEEICACVILDSESVVTLGEVRAHVQDKALPDEDNPMAPRPRHYLLFDAFPRTETGKPLRKVIKAEAAKRLQK